MSMMDIERVGRYDRTGMYCGHRI